MKLDNPDLFRTQAYIDGEWVDADDGAVFAVTNPADGSVLAEVPNLGVAETRRAIEAANAAWAEWRGKTAKQRAVLLRRWFELMVASQDDLAALMTAEQGKPLAESAGEILYGASFIEWFAEEGKRVYGDVIPTHLPDRRIVVIKQPVGVVAAITPWNFPNAMITRKAGPALAAGCPVVIKPASETPLSALALAELAAQAGIPAGVFNVLTTRHSSEVGRELTESPLVRKFSFTGSTEIGKLLIRQCASTVKKVSMELGGNAPFIVFDDADLDAAVQGAILSKYRNAGQTCVCANRIYVQDGVYEAFVERFTAAVRALKVGRGEEEGVSIGPLISASAVDKVETLLDDALGKGASVVEGGERHALGGYFYQPTVVRDVTADMAFATEEIFGPVAPIFRFGDEQEVIELANATEYGLASYFYARDLGRVWRVAEGLEYGMVCINDGILSTEVAPFGGVKESGIGREGSRYGIDEFIEIKYITMAGLGA
ncbi:MAG: succinate-semialdehyde dehydrogenase [Xanthomonadales bacterium]|nr:succinate-semialdehyde dehydrogenase [Xanthomonadales bacterium]NIN58931.1 succinate-semialdehyde dehydrogenase [Xanthomonadales bacterium]NIN74200.1 succinate-semialdehyde dehydrogenase [Xanthomonadales bacterium]NIO13871.1 succinate-semialdehyde dehydrogenase [Xanthomonadales bacterium]NIP11324.1 succinate-semialdehyde dehydrogenase [Xanthomonadales bacterium]